MVKLKLKLKAATLMEALIAMVIIVVSFGVAVMIYSNVLDSDKQYQQLKATLLLNQESILTKREKLFLDGEKIYGEWTIKKVISHYQGIENLYNLEFAVVDKQGKLIAKRNELIIIE